MISDAAHRALRQACESQAPLNRAGMAAAILIPALLDEVDTALPVALSVKDD